MIISRNLLQSWQLLKYSKWPLWGMFMIWVSIFLTIFTLIWLLSFLIPASVAMHSLTLLITAILIFVITAPIFAGLNMLAIKHARGQSIMLSDGFRYFKQWLPLALAFILIAAAGTIIFNFFLVMIPMLLPSLIHWHIAIPFFLMLLNTLLFNLIYTFFLFTIPLIVDRSLSIWEALKESIRIAQQDWRKLFGLVMILYVLVLLSILTLEIPIAGLICYIVLSIWLIPFIFLNIGVAYHQLVDPGEIKT